MSTLSELVAERRNLEDAAAENFGVIEESLEEVWEQNEAAIEDKIESWGHHLREREADLAVLDAEIKRLQERKRVRQGEYDRRRDFLASQMDLLGILKVDRPLLTVALQDNPPSVRLGVSVENLPPHFQRIVPQKLVEDKKAILAAHKKGEALPEGVFVEQGRSLRIR
jgi:septal ring factor EnvC (AmiA/AmiB activator)